MIGGLLALTNNQLHILSFSFCQYEEPYKIFISGAQSDVFDALSIPFPLTASPPSKISIRNLSIYFQMRRHLLLLLQS